MKKNTRSASKDLQTVETTVTSKLSSRQRNQYIDCIQESWD